MAVHEQYPTLDPIVIGQTALINLDVHDLSDTDRDWTGATVSVLFTHSTGSFTIAGVLDGSPSIGPQASVTVGPANTAALIAQMLLVVVTTTLAGGDIDKARFKLPLVA